MRDKKTGKKGAFSRSRKPPTAQSDKIERLPKAHKRRSRRPESTSIEDSMYLENDEIRALFRVISSKRDRAALMIALKRGLRAHEVGLLTLADFQRDRLFVRRGKGSISQEYSLTAEELHALRMWLKIRGQAPGPLFPSRNHRPISRRRLDELMKRYCEAAGIRREKAHMHALKHSCAVALAESGESAEAIKEWCGHRRITSTQRYLHFSKKRREEMAERQKYWRVT